MEEKDLHLPPTPGLPEALHPEIGNGAAFATNTHDYKLLSADPTKALEAHLPKNEVVTPERVGKKEEQPVKDETSSPDSTTASSSGPSKEEQLTATEDIRKKKTAKRKDIADTAQPDIDGHVAEQPAVQPETEDTKGPKPGKRIRKAAKAVQKQQRTKKEAVKKTVAKKAPAKKVPAVKKAVKKEPVREIRAETTPAKKVTPKASPKRDKFSLSPFTQWLKELGGGDYVHPYDDDFALKQEEGALNEVISETYANLLASQGYKERAIEMYLKLIEKYPEKSSFFAAKIEALQ
jgi:hypothetical protein